MKTKAIVAIIVTMLLVGMTFFAIPVSAQPVIKVGVIGPVGWPQFDGMQEGAILARDWINGPGNGITIGGTSYDVELYFADEHAADMRPDLGKEEMINLITVDECDFVYGGFRTECTAAIREAAMDLTNIYYICGSATNELIDCGTGTCGACVKCDYARYKYLFRITPINNTMLFYNILYFIQGYVLPYRLCPIYGAGGVGPVNTAVIAEDLDWTVMLWNYFTAFGTGGTGTLLGPQANVVMAASARTPYGTSDFSTYLDAMHSNQIRLVVQIYSAPDSIAFVSQAAAHPLKAVCAGIDVLGQSTEFWIWTGGDYDPPYGTGYADGGCQYESFLCSTGTRTPVSTVSQPYTTTEVWDLTFSAFGHAPIYTSWGVYDGIIALHDMLENNVVPSPPYNQDATKNSQLVPLIEGTDRNGVLGRFKYTNYHDPYSSEMGSTWTEGYVRALWGQWQAGRIEVVWPLDQPYSKVWAVPDETGAMYPYPEDVIQVPPYYGEVDIYDALAVRGAFGGYPAAPDEPAHPTWQFVADVIRDNIIDVFDALAVRAKYGQSVSPLPLAYCDEAGHMS